MAVWALSGLAVATVLAGCDSDEARSAASTPIINGLVDEGHAYVVGVGNQNGPFCTGTVISRRTVISAGHCFGGVSRVWFGTDASVSIDTVRELRHPDFHNQTLSHDVMMVELAADAPMSPVPLLRETMTNTPAFIGPPYTWVGFGDDENGDSGIRKVVLFPVDVVGPAMVGGSADTIDDSMVYFQVTNVNTCSGDSGGPGFLVRAGVERHALITSYGDPDCAVDGVAARTDQPIIDEFIQPFIDSAEGADPCRNNGVCDESCNTGMVVVDPDCHEAHCEADGMCASACVMPVDPDCMLGVDHCGADGVCDPSCTTADPDCQAPPDAGAPAPDAATVMIDASPSTPDAAPTGDDAGPTAEDAGPTADDAGSAGPDAGLADAGLADAGLGDAGHADAGPGDADPGGAPDAADAGQPGGGCGCRQSQPNGGLLLLLLPMLWRRRVGLWPRSAG